MRGCAGWDLCCRSLAWWERPKRRARGRLRELWMWGLGIGRNRRKLRTSRREHPSCASLSTVLLAISSAWRAAASAMWLTTRPTAAPTVMFSSTTQVWFARHKENLPTRTQGMLPPIPVAPADSRRAHPSSRCASGAHLSSPGNWSSGRTNDKPIPKAIYKVQKSTGEEQSLSRYPNFWRTRNGLDQKHGWCGVSTRTTASNANYTTTNTSGSQTMTAIYCLTMDTRYQSERTMKLRLLKTQDLARRRFSKVWRRPKSVSESQERRNISVRDLKKLHGPTRKTGRPRSITR